MSTHKLTTLFGAAGFSLFYWYASEPWGEPAMWAARAVAIALAAGWVVRTYVKERAFDAQAGAPAAKPSAKPVVDLAAGRSMASHRALNAGRARGHASSRRASASSPSRA